MPIDSPRRYLAPTKINGVTTPSMVSLTLNSAKKGKRRESGDSDELNIRPTSSSRQSSQTSQADRTDKIVRSKVRESVKMSQSGNKVGSTQGGKISASQNDGENVNMSQTGVRKTGKDQPGHMRTGGSDATNQKMTRGGSGGGSSQGGVRGGSNGDGRGYRNQNTRTNSLNFKGRHQPPKRNDFYIPTVQAASKVNEQAVITTSRADSVLNNGTKKEKKRLEIPSTANLHRPERRPEFRKRAPSPSLTSSQPVKKRSTSPTLTSSQSSSTAGISTVVKKSIDFRKDIAGGSKVEKSRPIGKDVRGRDRDGGGKEEEREKARDELPVRTAEKEMKVIGKPTAANMSNEAPRADDERNAKVKKKSKQQSKSEDDREKENRYDRTSREASEFFAAETAQKIQAIKAVEAEIYKRSAEADAFFEDLKKNSEQQREADRRLREQKEVLDRATRAISPVSPMPEDFSVEYDGINELSEEESKYCETFVHKTNLCHYCDKPLPLKPSKYLTDLIKRISRISTLHPTLRNPDARKAPWQQTIELCAQHHAEITVIPLGLRAGYPSTIDFLRMDQRLEDGWIWERILIIIREPKFSKVFNRELEEIEKVGKTRWGMRKETPEGMKGIIPGYYGSLGRAILNRHFRYLFKWYSSSLIDPHGDLWAPLSTNDFITHVLIPETAILLIMLDQESSDKVNMNFAAAYDHASKVREQSSEYGRWRFREEGSEAEKVLISLDETLKNKRRRLKKLFSKTSSTTSEGPLVDSMSSDKISGPSRSSIIDPSNSLSKPSKSSSFRKETKEKVVVISDDESTSTSTAPTTNGPTTPPTVSVRMKSNDEVLVPNSDDVPVMSQESKKDGSDDEFDTLWNSQLERDVLAIEKGAMGSGRER
ncbi:hypothetical protein M231_01286 [Tremella mesenterica]|uniref:Restriction of telomere capping protein 4 n=1 Tax=Tremella mesenterica TaxID=5217 RepID=A0A4Q1BTI1_TREME|nr:hypothetical protein M231_01286 [Tremella mesenterica]